MDHLKWEKTLYLFLSIAKSLGSSEQNLDNIFIYDKRNHNFDDAVIGGNSFHNVNMGSSIIRFIVFFRTFAEDSRTHSYVPSCEIGLQHNYGGWYSHRSRFCNPRIHCLGYIYDPVQVEVDLHQGAR